MSQKQRILQAMQRGQRITSLNALSDHGVMDLPKRISELRQDGNSIEQCSRKVLNRFGGTAIINEYWIERDSDLFPIPKSNPDDRKKGWRR